MMYVTPDSEAFVKSGLAKSAFRPEIYQGLPLDYYLPGIDTTSRLLRMERIVPKFYMTNDVFMAYYKPYEVAYQSLKQSNKAAPAWRKFMETLIRSANYIELNQLTRGSMELAAAAAARTLSIILNTRIQISPDSRHTYDLDTLNKIIRDIEENKATDLAQEVQAAGGVGEYMKLMARWIREAGQAVAGQLELVAKELREYIDAKREAEAAAAALAGSHGHGYSLEALSVWRFFDSPDEFRKRVRLLSAAALAFRQFSRSLPASLTHEMAEAMWGGVDGVTKMQSYMQLHEVLPSELALSEVSEVLFIAKLAQMSMHVYRHTAAVRPAIFIDKSGSMAEELGWGRGQGGMPKISLAAGLGLALYRKLSGLVYLFDTELDKVEPRDVIKVLLTIKADGGTAIDPVLEEIMRLNRRDYVYIIVSDGITEASYDTLRRFKASGLAKQTRVILVPPSGERYEWLEVIRRQGRVIKATDVAGFMAAARQALA
jgi:uncharacterized protein with von Willebrand factor type A (vWA) domain